MHVNAIIMDCKSIFRSIYFQSSGYYHIQIEVHVLYFFVRFQFAFKLFSSLLEITIPITSYLDSNLLYYVCMH